MKMTRSNEELIPIHPVGMNAATLDPVPGTQNPSLGTLRAGDIILTAHRTSSVANPGDRLKPYRSRRFSAATFSSAAPKGSLSAE